ncbi:hypothetical protein DXT88_06255 [Herbaspirillum lusitanum]|nr:hypothetical protein [Herbaspirillum lusitanum]
MWLGSLPSESSQANNDFFFRDFMNKSNTNAKIGAVLYIIWALLHVMAANSVYMMGRSLEPSMLQGRIFQSAWNLLFFSITGIAIAITLNWKNNVWGYWINFAVVGVADVGFILFVLVPGYMPVWPGILGPLFWVLAMFFSTIALLARGQDVTNGKLGSV